MFVSTGAISVACKKITSFGETGNQADIARYLGITPVALSRIRHRENHNLRSVIEYLNLENAVEYAQPSLEKVIS